MDSLETILNIPSNLQEKIDWYLSFFAKDSDIITPTDFSACSSLVPLLWLYVKWLQVRHKTLYKKNPNDPIIQKIEGIYNWLRSAMRFVDDWNECRLKEKETIRTERFKRFTFLLQYFQLIEYRMPVSRQDMIDYTLLEATQGKELKREYSIGSLFTSEQLTQVLKTQSIIQDSKLILVKSYYDNTTALFKEGDGYYYFVKDREVNETQTVSVDELVKLIFDANYYEYAKPSPLGLEVFSFDNDQSIKYPLVRSILDDINPFLTPEKGYAGTCSGLEIAAKVGSLESVQYFLEKIAVSNENAENHSINIWVYQAAFMAAVRHNCYEIVKILLASNKYIDVNKKYKDDHWEDYTALVVASENNYFKVVKELLVRQNTDINVRDNEYDAPVLVWAAGCGNADIVKILLANYHVDVNFKTKYGWTPLKSAAVGGYTEAAKLLLAHKDIDPNKQNSDGRTALMDASENGRVDVVKALLEHENIDPNTKDEKGKTALSEALGKRHFDVASLLLSHPKVDHEIKAKYQWLAFTPYSCNLPEVVSTLCNEDDSWSYKKKKTSETPIKERDKVIEGLTRNQCVVSTSSQVLATELHLRKQIKQYLELNNISKSFANYLDEDDFSNFSLLWLYVNKNATDSATKGSGSDYNWVENAIKLINNWSPGKSLAEDDRIAIEKFISLLQDIQCIKDELLSIWQVNNQDLKYQYFNKGYYLLFTPVQFKKTLDEESSQSEKVIFVNFNNHIAALFKDGEHYCCFSSYDKILEHRTSSAEELTQVIFDVNFQESLNDTKPSPLGFCTLSFDVGVLGYLGAILAAKTGSLESGQYFLNRGVNVADYGAMILKKAAYLGHVDIVKALLTHPEINPNIQNKKREAALIQSVYKGHIAVVKALLSHANINPNLQDACGKTALMWAIDNSNLDIVKELLAHKDTNPNVQDKFGNTALTLACLSEQFNGFAALLKDPDTDFNNIDFIFFKNKCHEKNNLNQFAYENHFNIIKDLLEHPKIDPNICNNNGCNILKQMVVFNDIEIMKELLKNNNPNINIYCNKALIVAAQVGNLEIIKILLAYPTIDPNVTDSYGYTALMEASMNGYPAIVSALLTRSDIDLNVQMKAEHGWTAIVYAAKCKHPEIVDILLTHPKIDTSICDEDGKTVFELIKQFLCGFNTPPLDGIRCTSESDIKKEIQKKIGQYLRFNQDVINPLLFKITKNKEIKKEYSIGSLFTLEQLKQVLEMLNAMQYGKLVLITASKTTVALFKDGEKYYCFSTNSKTDAVQTTSLEELVELIFDISSYKYDKPSPLGLEIFSFDGKQNIEYLSPKNVLNSISPFLVTESGYANGCSGLQIAAMVDSLESVQYFLEKGISPGVKDSDGITALVTASMYGYLDIVKELLAHKNFDISRWNEEKHTALAVACKNGYLEVVQALLAIPYFCVCAELLSREEFSVTLENRYLKIVRALLAHHYLYSDIKAKYKGNAFIDAFINDHLETIAIMQKNNSYLLYENETDKRIRKINEPKERLVKENTTNIDDRILINKAVVLEKLKCYLKCRDRNQSIINCFDESYHSSIFLLWAYAKWLQSQSGMFVSEQYPNNPTIKELQNGYKWFRSTLELISNWDIVRKLEEQEIIEVEKLIILIQEIQNVMPYLLPMWQKESEMGFKDVKYKIEYYLPFTADQFKKMLETDNIVQDDKLIFIKAGNNIASLFKHEKNYFYFDSNNAIGEVKVFSIEELIKIIFETNHQNQIGNKNSSSVVFCVLSCDPDAFEYLGLMLIAKCSNLHPEQYFLDEKELDNNRCSATLRKATYHGHTDIVKLLLANPNIDPNMQDEYGYTALMWAVDNGHLEIVKALLAHRNIDPNIRSKNRLSALALAFMFEELEIVRTLLNDKKIDLIDTDKNAYIKWKTTIKSDVVKQENHLGIIQALLAHPGIGPQTQNKNNWNSLEWIYIYGNYKIVNEILKYQTSSLNMRGEQGLAVIIEAAKNGCLEVVKTLLTQVDSDPHMKEGFSAALIEASRSGYVEVVRVLLAHPDIKPNTDDKRSCTALMWAAENNHVEVVKALLTHPDIDPNVQNVSNRTALMEASDYYDDRTEVVSALLLHPKTNINIQGQVYSWVVADEDGWTAVVYAAQNGHSKIVDMLLAHPNIDTSLRSKQGFTVSMLIDRFQQKKNEKP